MGMSCVIVVSRGPEAAKDTAIGSELRSCDWEGWRWVCVCVEGAAWEEWELRFREPRVLDVRGVGIARVRLRRGVSSFFVSRMEALLAFWADFKARWRAVRGTSRFIVLLAAAD